MISDAGDHSPSPSRPRPCSPRCTDAAVEVLMYTDSCGFGGAELQMATLAAALCGATSSCSGSSRLRVAVAALVHPGLTDDRLLALLDEGGVPWITAPRPPRKGAVHQILGLRAAMADRRCRRALILHCHQATPYSNHLAMGCAWSLGVPIVVTEHGYYAPDSAALSTRRRIMQGMTSHHIAVSHAVAESLERDLGLRRSKLTVVHNGVPPSVESGDHTTGPGPVSGGTERRGRRQDMRRALGIPDEALVIGAVGRQSPEKNLPTLVRAVGLLAETDPGVHLVLSGQGDDATQQQLRRVAHESGLDGRVLLPGRVPDLQGILASFDIFALASLTEGMPLALMEAMAAGLPSVVTAVGGVPELIEHEVTGLLVADPMDPAGLAAALSRLAGDTKMRTALGDEAARTVSRCFSLERMVTRTRLVYEHVARVRQL